MMLHQHCLAMFVAALLLSACAATAQAPTPAPPTPPAPTATAAPTVPPTLAPPTPTNALLRTIVPVTPAVSRWVTMDEARTEVGRWQADPILFPTNLPGNLRPYLNCGRGSSCLLEFKNESGERQVLFGIVIPNPPPITGNMKREERDFRNVKALYNILDTTQPTSPRGLIWEEPGRYKMRDVPGQPGSVLPHVPYVLSVKGLSEEEFWLVANGLQPLP